MRDAQINVCFSVVGRRLCDFLGVRPTVVTGVPCRLSLVTESSGMRRTSTSPSSLRRCSSIADSLIVLIALLWRSLLQGLNILRRLNVQKLLCIIHVRNQVTRNCYELSVQLHSVFICEFSFLMAGRPCWAQKTYARVVSPSQGPLPVITQHLRLISIPAARFEPAILVGEGPQTHALDRAATRVRPNYCIYIRYLLAPSFSVLSVSPGLYIDCFIFHLFPRG